MGNPNPLKRKDFIEKLKALGFSGPLSGGNHQVMFKNGVKIAIPNPHGNKDIGVIIISKVCKTIGIEIKEFMDI